MNKTKSPTITSAILRTVIYSDLFSFTLNKNELWYFLKSGYIIPKKEFLLALQKDQQELIYERGYYVLKKHRTIIPERIRRIEISKRKTALAKAAVKWLSLVPTVSFIGISGSVAQLNATVDDDIDLFIISKKNRIWITRIICLFILQLIGKRRTSSTRNEADTLCLNMFIDESALGLPQDRHDLFTAHEIAALQPLLNREQTYERFLFTNRWISEYLPNVLPMATNRLGGNSEIGTRSPFIVSLFFRLFDNPISEKIVRLWQLFLINRKRTTETVSNSMLAFHPYDHRKDILRKYQERIARL